MATFNGTEGNDTLFGGAAADEINGFGGNDFLQGGDGADSVLGGAGNDTISGNAGNDWVRGGAGNDQVAGGGGQDSFAFADFGAANADTLTDFAGGWDNIQLDLGAFAALGSTGRFVSGDARFHLGTAAADANDRIIYNQATGQLWYDADGSGAGAAQLIATLSNRGSISATDIWVYQSTTPPPPPPPAGQTINGTPGNDSLVGGAGNDTINGLASNDTLDGAGGNDWLDGGSGSDRLTGGTGADNFVLGASGADVIVGFASGTDKIVLDASVLTNLGASGNFSTADARFYSGGWPHDITDRIIYNTTTGELWYDADGTAIGASWAGEWPVLIATLEGAPTLNASDFVVINGSPTAGVSRDGTDGDDSIVGTSGDDTLYGGLGNDTLAGLGGNDVLDGGEGSDSVAGGDGNDTLYGGGEYSYQYDTEVDTLDGGLGNDTYVLGRQISISDWYDSSDRIVLRDSGGVDTVVARSGYWELGAGFENLELINGYGEGGTRGIGNELDNVIRAHSEWYVSGFLDGGDGNDTLIGGGGRDHFAFDAGSGNYGNDSVDGGGDEDTLDFTGARSAVVIDFRAGTATGGGTGGSGSVTFVNIDAAIGGSFNDLLIAPDTIVQHRYGDQWGPTLSGGGGDDTLLGGTQIDFLYGGTGDDEVRGGGGDDIINDAAGNDRLFGDAGNDWFSFGSEYVNGRWVGSGADTVDGGTGADTIYFAPAESGAVVDFNSGTIAGGNASVTFTNVENFTGGYYADRITGDAGANVLTGGGGDDTIFGGGGDDTLWVNGTYYASGGVTQAYGQDGNDTLNGGSSADRLEGGAGNDWLAGDWGRDTLVGGLGQDTLTGGGDRDTFVFDASPGTADADVVTDFASGQGAIWLDVLAMPQLGAVGTLAANDARFYAGTAAHDADDRIVFDTATGQLWYDADGSGSGAAQLIATINGTVAATDITVFNSSAPMGRQIDGTAGWDTLVGGGGDDTINGLGGDDYLVGGGGNDRLDGGAGYDRVFSGTGNDTLLGGTDWDTFLFLSSDATYGRDVVDGGGGWDSVRFDTLNTASGIVVDLAAGTFSGGGSNSTDGGTLAGIEQVNGTRFGDRISGDANANLFYAYAGNDTLAGGAGSDTLDGGDGNDSLAGGDGNDYLYSGAGVDTLDGGLGDDYYEVTAGDTIVADTGGRDTVSASGSWTLAPELEVLYVSGTSGGTFIGTGNDLDNIVQGNTWDASFVLSGLGGNDTLSGGGSNDTLLGGVGHDSLYGSYGADSLAGGDGNDTLNGSSGHDTLTGGAGADHFQFNEWPHADHADFISDFASGADKIHLDANAMSALGTGGNFSANDPRFYAAAGANAGHDVDDRVILNTTTGELWYDYDGSGTGESVLLATLQPGATLAATDIVVDNGGTAGVAVTGTAGNDSLVGTTANDTLNGLGGSDTLDGGAGADRLVGGPGNDVYYVDDQNDVVVEFENEGIDEVRAGTGYTLPDWVNNLTLLDWAYLGVGNAVDNVIRGNENWNSLSGLAGNDTLIGGAGRDTVSGGAGADLFVFDVAPDADWVTDFTPGVDRIQLDAGVMPALGATGQLGAGDARFYAAAGADRGHDADDRVIYNTTTGDLWYDADGAGSAAAQLIATLEGAPNLSASDISVANRSAGAVINGTAGNDSLVGTSNSDTINGFAGSDTIDGGAGADRMAGGPGDDVYFVDNANDAIVELESEGTDEARASASYTLPDWVNNLTLLSGALSGTGNAVDNAITGNVASNLLSGLGGNDTLIGGEGFDTLLGGAGNDSLDGGAGWDSLSGGDGNDTLVGGASDSSAGYQVLDGGAGADAMIGGTGNDWFHVDNAGDTLSDAGGYDGISSSISLTMPDWAEELSLTGAAAVNATGNALANTMYGNIASNVLRGLAGNDWLWGNDGSDTLEGGAGNDTLYGGNGADRFVFGSADADWVGDFLSGTDRIHLDAATMTALGTSGAFAAGDGRFWTGAAAHDADDRVIYDAGTGNLYYDADGNGSGAAQLIATLQSAPTLVATDITVDNGAPAGVVVNGTSGNDSLTGGTGNDTLNGFGGNDTLNGGAGADRMAGGPGDDLYFVDNAGDAIVEVENEGIDEARSTVSFTLPDWVNNLTLLAGAVNGTGNAVENVITGNSAANALSGGDGADTLTGGAGQDTLTGGTGADHFVFNVAPDGDAITDFASGVDKIRLDGNAMSAIGPSGNFAAGDARFWAGSAAHDADDRLIFNSATGQLWYDADGTGSGAAQLIATATGNVVATDIVVDNGTATPPPSGGINGTEGNDTLSGTTGNDTINGLGGNDFIQGNAGADTITGGAGNDTLGGNDAADWLEGGAGNDRVAGGSGQDAFVFREFGAANADTLPDFSGNNWETLRFDNAAFTALGADGRFVSGDARFRAGTAAADADDRIIYNSATAQVWYDADGNGAGAAQLVATLQAGAALVATDIWVI